MWFGSGAVLMFVPFPSLPAGELHSKEEAIDVARLRVPPSEIVRLVPGASRLKLVSVLGEPVYLAGFPQSMKAISGESGWLLHPLSSAQAKEIAEKFGRAAARTVRGPLYYDQWVVPNNFDRYRPFFKVSLADTDGTDIYVSAVTDQPVQVTTRHQRFWASVGAVLHWIYFPPVRSSFSLWSHLVWWLSLFALVTSLAGTWLGVYRFLQSRATKKKRMSFFFGWLRWHHIIGLFASLFVLIWIFSGLLSMDDGYWFSLGAASEARIARFRGASVPSVAEAFSLSDIRELMPAAEVEFDSVGGKPFMLALGAGNSPRIRLAGSQTDVERLPVTLLEQSVAAAWRNTPIVYKGFVSPDDMYYGSEGLYPGTLAFQLGPPRNSSVYIDSVSGDVVAVVNGSRRAYAWLFYGLHTFKVPGLISHPLLRESIELPLLALGFTFSLTGVVIGYRRLRRDLADLSLSAKNSVTQ